MINTKVHSINLLKHKSQINKRTTQKFMLDILHSTKQSNLFNHFAQKLSHTTQKSSPFNRFAQTTQKLSHFYIQHKKLFYI
jgi:hypothetical protein